MAHKTLRFNSRDEWLEARTQGIGASEVASIVGLNPYETPYEFWRRKTGLDAPKEYTFAMRAGHYLEDAVSLFFQDSTGHQIIKASAPDFMIVNTEKEFLRVSPDRTYWQAGEPHNEENKCILECKTTQKTIEEDNIPKQWFCQLQMNLGVAEMSRGSLAWLTAGRTFGYKEYNFVPDFYAWLVEQVERFWRDCIIGKREPDAISYADILLKYPREELGKIIEVGEDIYECFNKLHDVRDEISKMEEQKEALEDELKKVFEDAEAISYHGQTLATWKAPKDTEVFDAKAFQADHPEMAKEYMKTKKSSRRFLLKSKI